MRWSRAPGCAHSKCWRRRTRTLARTRGTRDQNDNNENNLLPQLVEGPSNPSAAYDGKRFRGTDSPARPRPTFKLGSSKPTGHVLPNAPCESVTVAILPCTYTVQHPDLGTRGLFVDDMWPCYPLGMIHPARRHLLQRKRQKLKEPIKLKAKMACRG